MQQTLVRAMESTRSNAEVRTRRAYLFAIARRVLFAHFKEQARQGKVDAWDVVEEPADGETDPERGALARLSAERLPVEMREVVQLAYWEGLSRAEIADVLALPVGTVASRLRRAIVLLRRGQGEEGPRETVG